ncbi:hypothetical protein BDA99DRAFT_455086 [Phascolomyces articulosus]|uniref:F-box/LRR-repeat protein 15-like leucin rich repeat domain-containing protein n=1 Tax=Phascolomyces articulosus TaxID=60185 RepID=A0AAD5KQV1_9FUNG|nr:hypothetical protein BDA99DRAFT_455086 [Phascolomyces articulosus]
MDELPSEIIQLILHHLDGNQTSIANINSTCKSLYYASLQHLYQQPRFSTIQRFQSFIQNLNEKTAKCIRTIDLSLTAHRWEPVINTLILNLTNQAKNIERLNLCLCHLESGILYSCAKTSKQLQYLSINGNRHVDDTTLASIIPFLKELRELDIGATAIRDRSLILIAEHCKKLESLDVSDCYRITEQGIRCVTAQLPQLNYLSIENCYNVVSMDGEFDGITVEDEGDWEDEDDEEQDENEQVS